MVLTIVQITVNLPFIYLANIICMTEPVKITLPSIFVQKFTYYQDFEIT